MPNCVAAMCTTCGRVRSLDPYREPRDWEAKTAPRRCATCQATTEHSWINHPRENRRAEDLLRRTVDVHGSLEAIGHCALPT